MLAFVEVGHGVEFLVLVVFLDGCRVHGGKALKFDALALDYKTELFITAFTENMHSHRVVLSRRHLRSHKTLVHEFVEPIRVSVHFAFERFRSAVEVDGTDCLVRVLRVVAGLVNVLRFRSVFASVVLGNEGQSDLCKIGRNTHAVGTDVSDECVLSLALDVDALVKLLRNSRRAFCRHVELVARLLLHCGRGERRCGF